MMSLALLCGVLAQAPPASDRYPHPDEFARQVRRGLTLGFEAQRHFTFLERRRDVDISMLGRVTIGPLRTFEAYPSDGPEGTYKRLIEIEGQPLSEAELARRDAEHERHVREASERARAETPRQRTARLRAQAEERRKREAILDDAIAVFEARFAGRESIDGHLVWVADLTPRQDAQVTTREGQWMKHFEGRIWIAAADYQLVQFDMRASSDVTIGFGVIGRLHAGSRAFFSRRRFDGAWLPAELTYEARGRTLLVRPFSFSVTTTYSDYRRHPLPDVRPVPGSPPKPRGARSGHSSGRPAGAGDWRLSGHSNSSRRRQPRRRLSTSNQSGGLRPPDPVAPSLAGAPMPRSAPAFAEATAGRRSLGRGWPAGRAVRAAVMRQREQNSRKAPHNRSNQT